MTVIKILQKKQQYKKKYLNSKVIISIYYTVCLNGPTCSGSTTGVSLEQNHLFVQTMAVFGKPSLKVPYNALIQHFKLFSDIYIEGMWLRKGQKKSPETILHVHLQP